VWHCGSRFLDGVGFCSAEVGEGPRRAVAVVARLNGCRRFGVVMVVLYVPTVPNY